MRWAHWFGYGMAAALGFFTACELFARALEDDTDAAGA